MSRRRYPLACWLIGLAWGAGGALHGQTPPVITDFPASRRMLEGESVILTVNATGSLPIAYQWYRNDQKIPGATESSYLIPSASQEDVGTYSVSASNSSGMAPAAGSGNLGAGNFQSSQSLFLRSNGTVWGMGENNLGQLGDGTNSNLHFPTLLAGGVDRILSVASGAQHYLYLRDDGTLWGVGFNGFGQLGDGTTITRTEPVLISDQVRSIAANGYLSMFIKNDGTLWAMGVTGPLVDGTEEVSATPIQISDEVSFVAVGTAHSLFIKTDGKLWAVGDNSYGQLGDGTTTNRIVPIQIASGVATAAAGWAHSLYIKTDGTLWAMGLNQIGQLGDGTTTDCANPVLIADKVNSVAAGYQHSLFVRSDGTLWGMGWNSYGQLGDGSPTNRHTPVQVASEVSTISAGFEHSLFSKTDGSLWGMGRNWSGTLGIGENDFSYSTPVQIATGLSLAANLELITQPVIGDQPVGGVKAVGDAIVFEVTASGGALEYQWRKDGVAIPSATSPTYTISSAQLDDAGDYDVQVSNEAGSITSEVAELTVKIPAMITSPPVSQSVSLGESATFSVTATGTAPLNFQWYKNGQPIAGATGADYQIASVQLSDSGIYSVSVANDVSISPAATAQIIAAGLNNGTDTPHSLFVKADGTLWGLGNNIYGQLGIGATNAVVPLTQVASGVKAVATGAAHSLFVKYDGTLWATGRNQFGQLGNSSNVNPPNPVEIAVGVVAVAAGANHSLFLKDDGTLWAMGRNQFGQLGDGTTEDRWAPVNIASNVRGIAAGREFSLFLKEDGTLWAMGDNSKGQLGDGLGINRLIPALVMGEVSTFAAGDQHSLIMQLDGSLWTTGYNSSGQLGVGTMDDQVVPVWIADRVIAVGAGKTHSFFIRTDEARWGMGNDYYGVLSGNVFSPNQPSPMPTGDYPVRAMSMGEWNDLMLSDGGVLRNLRWSSSPLVHVPSVSDTEIASGLPQAALLTVTSNGPEITSPPRSRSALAGDAVGFAVVAMGPGPLSYQWRKDGNPIVGANVASLNFDSVEISDAGRYDVVVSNGVDQTISPMATLWVQSRQPVRRIVGYGNAITLDAEVTGDILGYQWLRWGGIIAGANSATYTIPAAGEGDTGQYSVLVTGINGSILLGAGWLSAGPATGSDGVLLGLSTRGWVGTGDDLMITGFWVEGSDSKQVVLRGIGPSMAAQGVSGTVADPRLDLYRSDGLGGNSLLASNDNWENTPANVDLMNAIGLATPSSELESVLALNLEPGVYTAHLSGSGTGVGLLEVYDADSVLAPDLPKLAAISTRGVVRTDDEVLIGGFIITGTEPKLVLVQVVGPSLAGAGITGLLEDPRVGIVRLTDHVIVAENNDWEVGNDIADMMAARVRSGATPLATGSRDAAILTYLPPGIYTAVASGTAGSTGVALMNIYEVPPE